MTSARSNGLWAVSQQLITVGLSGIFSIALIRVLPVSEFGIFSYATTLAALGVSIMTGGMQALAVRELRGQKHDRRIVLGAVFFIREAIALVVYALFVIYSSAFVGGGVALPAAFACLAVLARVVDAPELVFQADLRTKTPALIRSLVGIGFFAIRMIAIFTWPSLELFIGLFVLEQLIAGLTILLAYSRAYGPNPFSWPEVDYTRTMAKHSAPLSLSGIANQVNLRADVVILQTLSGSISVALYSAAARLSELLYVIPTAYMSATFPSLLDLKNHNKTAEYRRALEVGFSGAFYLGVSVAVAIWFSADWIVSLLFGPDYAQSARVLQIHVLACPFVFMAAVLSKWIVAEGLLWISFLRHAIGATLAVTLNLALIPTYGIDGAAWATVASYSAASYLFCFFSRPTFGIALTMTRAPLVPLLHFTSRLRGKS
ncbi:flippase [Microbacterium aurantiacum]|uniref:Flippase n=1 Tax=Microbacterium aurantiacum TaxID=162393 RepID=A0AAJ2LXC7_9MICO|nr:flippase [Microbacterium aurantiacum]MDS0244243.1 flippase [Microbacterium aurantiacum]